MRGFPPHKKATHRTGGFLPFVCIKTTTRQETSRSLAKPSRRDLRRYPVRVTHHRRGWNDLNFGNVPIQSAG